MSFSVTRRWTDPRDGRTWEIVQARNRTDKPPEPFAKPARNVLTFACGEERYTVAQRVGGHLDSFSGGDLQALLDWARKAGERAG